MSLFKSTPYVPLHEQLIGKGYKFYFTPDRRVRVEYAMWLSKGAETTFSFRESFTLREALMDHNTVTWLVNLGV